ncbi:MAG: 3-isopropylmalate dehydratase [Saprospiraceae bacterium]|nr:3-isopropylmalate dehydratase [Saprospiraceae bacterium]MDW8483260.1 3-isopropylmalate dehydratase [Saprospiraceae bacterium]
MKITGKCWVASGYVMAYDIITQPFWTSPIDLKENARWVMAGVSEEFNRENGFASQGYTFIVAGHNFAGGGKSIEHVITGLMGAGIKAVFADSFARLQFRNAINYGLPFVTCKDIAKGCHTGDQLEWDSETGVIRNLTNGKVFQAVPLAPFVIEIAQAGGLMNFIRKRIAEGTISDLH